MTKRLPVLFMALAAAFSAAMPAFGQSSLSFSYTLADGNAHPLTTGTTITFPSVDINATTSATVVIANSGSAAGTVTGIGVTGTGFRLNNPTLLPANVAPGGTLAFAIVFAPSQIGSSAGTFEIDVPAVSITGTLAGATPPPNFVLEYIDPSTGNTLPLPNKSTLQFPNTQVGTTATIAILVANTGSGTGSVTAAGLTTGTVFQVVSLAPLPVSVGPSLQLAFGIRFTPLQQQQSSDVLTVTANGQTTTVNLQAQAVQPTYSYQFSSSGGTTTVLAGGTAAIPDTTVGQTTNVTVTVTNTGLGAGQVTIVGVTGQGLTVSNVPATPFTLNPGASQQFTLTFAPTQPGAVSGRLTFGSDTITIAATGVGPQLLYTYTSGSSAIAVLAGGTVVFTPVSVGSTESLAFSIQNTGTSAATLSSVGLSVPSTVFTVSGTPAPAATLNPGATVSFSIAFSPNNTGNLTATLLVNSSSFTLSGNGTAPPSLPAYSFAGPSGTEQPDQQPDIGLTLASPYPLPLQGTLTLTFNSSVFADDSTIQFANGGRTVNFTIPANATQALFSGNATGVPLQTGTTSGNIVITPSFALADGFNLTPASPNVSTLAIPGLAPQLLTATLSAVTTTSFTVILSGYTTTRVLSHLSVQLTPVQGHSFNPDQLTIDVSSASAAWFQGTSASGFGGSFLAEIPFALSNGSSTANLVQLLQSLSITATNEVGTSSAIVVPIQ
jgi:hypothetical protein